MFLICSSLRRSNSSNEEAMEYDEETRALDEWAKADPNRMTIEEALAEGRRLRGPPYRMTIEYPSPVLTEEEEAAALAQAEYDDITGNFEPDPEYYIILRAQNLEDAKRGGRRALAPSVA
jgi:hypothetical protein